ncbi:hypothetical protein GCM10022422_34590 [Flavobacterium ginsengisoli]|uniref:Uncharacterized protein n=1 Tax=Flavobacterium ginsengisoli TaxID=871694 RepID=A0ABP7FT45_9FLAO
MNFCIDSKSIVFDLKNSESFLTAIPIAIGSEGMRKVRKGFLADSADLEDSFSKIFHYETNLCHNKNSNSLDLLKKTRQ